MSRSAIASAAAEKHPILSGTFGSEIKPTPIKNTAVGSKVPGLNAAELADVEAALLWIEQNKEPSEGQRNCDDAGLLTVWTGCSAAGMLSIA